MPTKQKRISVIVSPELQADYDANKQGKESMPAFLLRRAGYESPKHGGRREIPKRGGKREDR
jgi:hypothetical protein